MDAEQKKALQAHVLEALSGMGDYSFLPPEDLAAIVETLAELDAGYMESAQVEEGGVYDDEAAFELLFEGLKERFPQYQMFCMRLAEDYMDAVEEYLDSIGALEWD